MEKTLALVTMHDDIFRRIAEYSNPQKAGYCARHGYGFFSDSILSPHERPAAWYKLKSIQKILPLFDWVFWTDSDAVVWNHEIPLDRHIDDEYDIIASKDINGINLGNFFIRDSEFTKKLFLDWWECPQKIIVHMWWDQKRFIDLYEESETIRNRTKIVDQKYFNAYDVDESETIIRHYPGLPPAKKLEAVMGGKGQ